MTVSATWKECGARKRMKPVLALSATLSLAALLTCGNVGQAWALAYVIPEVDPNNAANNLWTMYPFGRVLWNVPIDPVEKTMTLTYAFQPKAPAVNFKWETAPNTFVTKKNKDFTSAQKTAINVAAGTWNAGIGGRGNLRGADLGGKFDLGSTALHELGHAIGIGHPNADGTTTWDPATGAATHISANENVNVAGNPATFPVPLADKNNLAKTNALQAVDVLRPVPVGLGGTEAAMIQGAFPNETQRRLAYDDQQALSGIESGADFLQGTGDEFNIVLKETSWDQPHLINIFNLDLAGAEGLTRWIYNDLQNPQNFQFSRIFLDEAFGSDGVTSQISLSDLLFTSDYTETSSAFISMANIYIDADTLFVPEPSTLAGLAVGLAGIGLMRRKRAA